MVNSREEIINKIIKATEIQEKESLKEVTLKLSESELRFIKLAVKSLDAFQSIIEDECMQTMRVLNN